MFLFIFQSYIHILQKLGPYTIGQHWPGNLAITTDQIYTVINATDLCNNKIDDLCSNKIVYKILDYSAIWS